jgi:hypothetical protein
LLLPGKKINRVVVKYIIVIKAIGKHFYIKGAAHGKQVRHHFGVFKRKVGCMVTAKTAACNSYFANAGFVHGPGGKLILPAFYRTRHNCGPVGRVDAFIVPATVVNSIRAVNFHQAFINKPFYALNQPKIFVLVIAAFGSREKITGKPRSPNTSISRSVLNLGSASGDIFRSKVLCLRL